MNHLFKLKKDGKTVGYLRFAKYRPQSNNDLCVQSKCVICNGTEWNDGDTLDYDSIHPFVCKDKNGKDVFANDCCHSGYADGYIRWSEAELAWIFEWDDKRGDTHSVRVSKLPDIELIEESQE